jgi:ribonuclease HI
MSDTAVYTIHTDGAARGNPGPAAFAYVITRDGAPVDEHAACLGKTTNNVAEYTALVRALERAGQLSAQRLVVHSDSELMVKQMNGQYQVKSEDLRGLYEQAKQLSKQFHLVSFVHVRRGQNSHADRLCNEVLDGAQRPTAPAGRARKKSAGVAPAREDAIRDEAVTCLRSAAAAWARGDARTPAPEAVWEQLWSILEEQGVVRPARPSDGTP